MKASLVTLESKIRDLESQKKKLIDQRHREILSLLSQTDLHLTDTKTLMGGFLFLSKEVASSSPNKEAWRTAGEKFLRSSRNRKVKNTGSAA